jgi:nicotinamidase-related amidase
MTIGGIEHEKINSNFNSSNRSIFYHKQFSYCGGLRLQTKIYAERNGRDRSGKNSLVGPTVIKHKVVEKEKTLKTLAKKLGIPVFYSTHMYTPQDFANWKSLNGIDKIMFENKMFAQGTWGIDYHPELKPDSNTIVMNPHKGLSNFWTGDAALQLRQYGVETIILYGMSANMCVESHARDAIENGFDVIIIADATAAAGDAAYEAALTNYKKTEKSKTGRIVLQPIRLSSRLKRN